MKTQYRILIIRNRIKYPLTAEIDLFRKFLADKTPFEPVFEYLDTNLPLKYKDFMVKNGQGDQSWWGLDGVKQQLRDLNVIRYKDHDTVFFLHEATEFLTPGILNSFAYANGLEGCGYAEISCQEGFKAVNNSGFDKISETLCHEQMHIFHQTLWRRGIVTRDTMDNYDLNWDPYNSSGNFARNLKELEPYWNKISISSIQRMINELMAKVAELQAKLALTQTKSLLDKTVEAIKKMEGWYLPGTTVRGVYYSKGSISYQNNNPGNLRFTAYTRDYLGALPGGVLGFSRFTTPEAGANALKKFITHAATNKLIGYNAEMTLIDFFSRYAPKADSNEPVSYAIFVAKDVGVTPQTKIKELLK